jgi:hypothetical protein
MIYRIYDYDVWNDGEGFSVNDVFKTGMTVELNDDDTNENIISELINVGYLLESTTTEDVQIDGEMEYGLYLTEEETGIPIGELRVM